MYDLLDGWRNFQYAWPGSRSHERVFAILFDQKYGLDGDNPIILQTWLYIRNGFSVKDLPALVGASEEEIRNALEVLGLR